MMTLVTLPPSPSFDLVGDGLDPPRLPPTDFFASPIPPVYPQTLDRCLDNDAGSLTFPNVKP